MPRNYVMESHPKSCVYFVADGRSRTRQRKEVVVVEGDKCIRGGGRAVQMFVVNSNPHGM